MEKVKYTHSELNPGKTVLNYIFEQTSKRILGRAQPNISLVILEKALQKITNFSNEQLSSRISQLESKFKLYRIIASSDTEFLLVKENKEKVKTCKQSLEENQALYQEEKKRHETYMTMLKAKTRLMDCARKHEQSVSLDSLQNDKKWKIVKTIVLTAIDRKVSTLARELFTLTTPEEGASTLVGELFTLTTPEEGAFSTPQPLNCALIDQMITKYLGEDESHYESVDEIVIT